MLLSQQALSKLSADPLTRNLDPREIATSSTVEQVLTREELAWVRSVEAPILEALQSRFLGRAKADHQGLLAKSSAPSRMRGRVPSADPTALLSEAGKSYLTHLKVEAEAKNGEAMEVLRSRVEKLGYPPSAANLLVDYFVNDVPLTVNFRPDLSVQGGDAIDGFICNERYKTFFEVGEGLWTNNDAVYGSQLEAIREDVPAFAPKDFPISVGLNICQEDGALAMYGPCHLELSQKVKPRVTILSYSKTQSTFEHPEGAAAALSNESLKQILQHILEGRPLSSAKGWIPEGRFHGPLRFREDVGGVVSSRELKGTEYEAKIRRFARLNGLKFRWRDDDPSEDFKKYVQKRYPNLDKRRAFHAAHTLETLRVKLNESDAQEVLNAIVPYLPVDAFRKECFVESVLNYLGSVHGQVPSLLQAIVLGFEGDLPVLTLQEHSAFDPSAGAEHFDAESSKTAIREIRALSASIGELKDPSKNPVSQIAHISRAYHEIFAVKRSTSGIAKLVKKLAARAEGSGPRFRDIVESAIEKLRS